MSRGLQQALHSVSRREFGVGAGALMAATSVGTGCGRAAAGYEESIRRIWAPLRAEEGMRELVRAGTLAANSHNTQPWRFKVSERSIAVLPDLSRRTAVVDPDNHHVFCSLGCATENIVQAAGVFGHSATAEFDDARGQVVIALTPTSVPASPLSAAIVERQCTRAEYDGRVLPKETIAALQAAGSTDGVTCTIIEDRRRLESVLEAITEANSAQMGDKAFVAELVTWLRFNDAHALDTLDGLFTRISGNPPMPPWLGRQVIGLFMTEKSENDRYARHVRSSSGVAVFSSTESKSAWVAAGRAYQRFALQATLFGVRHAFVNQPVEVAALRPKFAALLGLGAQRPDLVIRFGYGPVLPRALRRPVEAVIESV